MVPGKNRRKPRVATQCIAFQEIAQNGQIASYEQGRLLIRFTIYQVNAQNFLLILTKY